MIRIVSVLVIYLVCGCVFGCNSEVESENCHKIILFRNSSQRDIYILVSSQFPDTLAIQHSSRHLPDPNVQKIYVNTSLKLTPSRDGECWEDRFNSKVKILPADTLMIYVLDAKLVESMSWDSIVNDYEILKRYDLSLQDLRKNNWSLDIY